MGLERDQIEELAARWVSREDRGLAPDESAALAAWLDRATANRLAYLRLKAGWEKTERLAALQGGEAIGAGEPWWLRRRALVAAAAVLTLMVVGAWLHTRPVPPSVYTSHLGERPVLHLSDGTSIQLNAGTQVQTSVTRAQRTVTLERGEAYFEVVHDASRPFVVLAGDRRLTDLGT